MANDTVSLSAILSLYPSPTITHRRFVLGNRYMQETTSPMHTVMTITAIFQQTSHCFTWPVRLIGW